MADIPDEQALVRALHALDAAAQAQRLAALDADTAARVRAALARLGGDTCADAAQSARETAERVETPQRIGPYKLIAQIGEGGMGAVWLAEQASPARRVALKLMRADWQGAEAHARFDREAAVLARLEHPNIARLFDAGVADFGGRAVPYLALEYVQGEPLGAFASRHQPGPRALIPLLVTIAQAVQHAHLRGVVHRDLKPGNILVDAAGAPHILDFGIAHLTEGDDPGARALTRTGQMIGTLQYMSPEQYAGDPRRIDGRTDVYALGVIAFQLFTGELPHRLEQASLLDAARIVTRQAARTMSSLRRELRGDLELIVAKALATDLAQRYASAADFAADLVRYARHEPVLARAPSLRYRASRFVRRHWLPLAAGALVLLSLAGGLIASWRAATREAQARSLAERRASEAQAVTTFLETMLQAASPDVAQGKELSVRAVIDRALGDETLRPTDPLVRARVERLLGSLLIELGDARAALPLLTAAVSALEPVGEASEELRKALSERATAQGLLGDQAAALADARRVHALVAALDPPDPQVLDDAVYSLSLAQYNGGDLDAARASIEAALRPLAPDAGAQAQGQIDLRNTLGRIHNAAGRHADALAVRAEIMDWYLRVRGPRSARTLSVQSNYAVTLSQLDRDPEAVELLEATLPVRIELLGPEHVEVAVHEVNLATSLRLLERWAEALPLLRDGERIFRARFGPGHPRTLLAAGYVAEALARSGEPAAGLEGFEKVLAGYQAIDQGSSRWALLARNDYARTLLLAGRLDAAQAQFARIDTDRTDFASNRQLQAELDLTRGLYWQARGDFAQARPLLAAALANFGPPGGHGPVATRIARALHATELALGDTEAAAQLARDYRLELP